MNILFKCDQSSQIGLGHYYRCLALADVFKKKKHKCYFLGLKPGVKKKNKIKKKDEKKDLIFTQKFIKKKKIQITIKDAYSLNHNWERSISKKTFLVVIDDYKNTKHYCDVYINYHLNWFKKKNFRLLINKTCRKLIGPKYTIVRELKVNKKIKFKKKTIFIYMGGSDKNMFMQKFAKLFKIKEFDELRKIFLLNKNHLNNSSLLKDLKKIKNTKILKNKIKNFHVYLASSDLVISPAGITMLEQISLRSNSLIIAQNVNQEKTSAPLYKAKVINFVKNIKNLNYRKINNFLNKKKLKNQIINKKGKNLIYKNIVSNL